MRPTGSLPPRGPAAGGRQGRRGDSAGHCQPSRKPPRPDRHVRLRQGALTRPLAGPRARGQDRDRRGHVWHADHLDSLLQNEILPFLPRDIARLLPRIVTALRFTETHLPTFHGLLGHTRHACGVCKCKLTMTRPRRSPLCTSLRLLVNLASLLN